MRRRRRPTCSSTDSSSATFTSVRVQTANTHGTGCTFASAIAAGLAKGMQLGDAVALAKSYVTLAIQHAYPIGHGHGPVHHFYRYWQPQAEVRRAEAEPHELERFAPCMRHALATRIAIGLQRTDGWLRHRGRDGRLCGRVGC